MTKLEFIEALNNKLRGLPEKEVDDRLSFYVEMIDDIIEEGLSEEEAIAKIGSVDEIADQIIADIPFSKIAKKKMKSNKKRSALEITLIILGSPIWFSLLIAAASIVISLYACLWSAIVSIWAGFASIAACAPAGIIFGIYCIFTGNAMSGFAVIGAGIFLAGLSIFAFVGCKALTSITVKLTKKIAIGIKKLFVKKEEK